MQERFGTIVRIADLPMLRCRAEGMQAIVYLLRQLPRLSLAAAPHYGAQRVKFGQNSA